MKTMAASSSNVRRRSVVASRCDAGDVVLLADAPSHIIKVLYIRLVSIARSKLRVSSVGPARVMPVLDRAHRGRRGAPAAIPIASSSAGRSLPAQRAGALFTTKRVSFFWALPPSMEPAACSRNLVVRS